MSIPVFLNVQSHHKQAIQVTINDFIELIFLSGLFSFLFFVFLVLVKYINIQELMMILKKI